MKILYLGSQLTDGVKNEREYDIGELYYAESQQSFKWNKPESRGERRCHGYSPSTMRMTPEAFKQLQTTKPFSQIDVDIEPRTVFNETVVYCVGLKGGSQPVASNG
ncbi:MAG TPA: hypothetical protein VGK14_04430 [Novimethylophilus sp.]|jgi:hypothetical protein|uniref:hypothetical protein n=1 Tax=Novimethylophilus sp. TaxID=2137426 RepID=UPI002F401DFC